MRVLLTVVAALAALPVVAMALTDERAPEVVTVRSAPPTPEVDDDRRLWPEEARRARRAALRVTGGGTVVELDRSDDPGEAYEVEVVKDGREHDVALDLDFEPVPNRRYDD